MTERRQAHRLTAAEVLQRYMDDNLPAFVGIDLLDVNQVGVFRDRPLTIAASRGNTEEIIALLEGGADINGIGELGNTPLHMAVSQNRPEAVQLLLRYGPALDSRNEFGNTPLERAREKGYETIVKLLETAAKEGPRRIKDAR